ncbi:LLM class flavin-dependent oxidoreductase [Actinomycetospora endophytica]|uniref:LLM class flavin-dependent oxidoreductase n=1 Tax=Actinomycetospora endophytica TaxID=2291215 RepID=A0ABS8PI11_9PSEU|nr:LLM class flavin-dependent oxidoreductase [Actinomycetospora endophytica]MCD2197927.1 LLM class flavin-dependent oxidoreductase [Actinomycetospora endophytica]
MTTVEFIGMIGTRVVSEIHPASGPPVDPAVVRRFVDAHEQGGFDKVLVGHSASTPDGLQVAAYGASHSERLGFLVAHRPGFVAPTVAARSFATLDQLSGGRVAMHVISGGNDADQRRDGDHLDKDARYRRTDEYLDIVTRTWTSPTPFDHDGEHYHLEDVSPDVRPRQQPCIPIYFGGSSPAAYRVGGKHADVFALWGEPLAETAEQIVAVHEAARQAGRTTLPRISVSFRPILGATEEQAWARAHDIRDRILGTGGAAGSFTGTRMHDRTPANVGSQRLLAAADRGERHDRALWTATAAATGAAGNSTALVGTPETVAAALLDYVDLGVTTLLIRGYDPIDDAVAYGRDLLPLVRAELARRAPAGAQA